MMKSIKEQRLHNSPTDRKPRTNKFRIPVIAYNTLINQDDSIRIQVSPNRKLNTKQIYTNDMVGAIKD